MPSGQLTPLCAQIKSRPLLRTASQTGIQLCGRPGVSRRKPSLKMILILELGQLSIRIQPLREHLFDRSHRQYLLLERARGVARPL